MCNVEVWRIKSFNERKQSKIIEPATYRSFLHRKREVLKHTLIEDKFRHNIVKVIPQAKSIDKPIIDNNQ